MMIQWWHDDDDADGDDGDNGDNDIMMIWP